MRKVLLLFAIGLIAIPGIFIKDIVEGQVVSGPVSYAEETRSIEQPIVNVPEIPIGVIDKKNNLIYYTEKDLTSWGSKESIYIYSILEGKVIKEIKFDNSGYYKYPVSLSPDSKYLVIAERAQSIGEVKLSLINLVTGNEQKFPELVYSPSLAWTSNNKYVYLTVENTCRARQGCTQSDINLREYEVGGKSRSISRIAGRQSNGILPSINKLTLENNNVIFEDSVVNTKRMFNLSTNVNSIL